MPNQNRPLRKNSSVDSLHGSERYCHTELKVQNSPNKFLNQKHSPNYSEDDETSDSSEDYSSTSPNHSPESTSALGRRPLRPDRGQNCTKESSKNRDKTNCIRRKHDLVTTKVWMLIIVVVISCSIYYGLNFITGNEQKGSRKLLSSSPDQAIKLIKEMKKLFPAQAHHTWSSFYSALENVKQEEPSQPAVLLLIGENTAKYVNTIDCVAKKLAEVTNKFLSSKMNTAEISVQIKSLSDFPDKQDEIIKRELDLRIRSILNQSNSIVLRHLEDLPPRAALLLHGYCDNFEAPFKKTVFILTATFVDKPIDSKQLDRKLINLWTPELGLDRSASLVSRVANSPIFIEPETGAMPCSSSYPTEL